MVKLCNGVMVKCCNGEMVRRILNAEMFILWYCVTLCI